ncbi:uncharacterized protein LOC110061879 [Orbicella faveolata]|uniref:uncharacterized protein LOC110061879 n=1 Tax=Orbicella faveolata TaxID=48498 RepID=UPI0009E365C1|nr:uncharacterized protein LOC110061879 [Orbicella faveolata]
MANVSKDNSSKIEEKTATIFLNRTNSHNVTIGGDCGSINNDAKLILSWPSKSYYTLTMVFSEKAKALEAKSNSSEWKVEMITLNVTLESNPNFPNATGKTYTY